MGFPGGILSWLDRSPVDGERSSVEVPAGHRHLETVNTLALGRDGSELRFSSRYEVYVRAVMLFRKRSIRAEWPWGEGWTDSWYRCRPIFRNWFQALFQDQTVQVPGTMMLSPISVTLNPRPCGEGGFEVAPPDSPSLPQLSASHLRSELSGPRRRFWPTDGSRSWVTRVLRWARRPICQCHQLPAPAWPPNVLAVERQRM